MLKILGKVIGAILVVALIVVGIVFIPGEFKTLNSALMISSYTKAAPKFIAHRGFSSLYPENTMPAFIGAKEYGFDGFEFDIHTTKDGEWVVIHDDDVDHMTNGTEDVDSYTFEEIRKLKIDNGNGIENYENLKVPALEETLEFAAEEGIVPVIEIKKCDVQYLGSLKEMLDRYGLSETAIIISFDEEYLEEYRKLDSNIEMHYLANSFTKEDIDWCIENNFGMNFNCWLLYKNFEAIRYAKENNVKIVAWTVDNTLFADIMVLFGAEYITTNKILP